jgi:hypothetical protein
MSLTKQRISLKGKEKTTKPFEPDRRDFLKKTGNVLFAAAAGPIIALSATRAHAVEAVVVQTKKTQAAITPQQALHMLKEGNTRFVQGTMLKSATLVLSRVRQSSSGCVRCHKLVRFS